MTDQDLLGLIRYHEAAAMGGTSVSISTGEADTTYGTLDVERATALDYYHGRPLGNEVEGRSQVISQDVRDIVEWIKPQILRMFVDADEIVRFEPEGPNDEAQAVQETDVINYIIMRQNDGVMVLHDALTDALILKNGYVKVWYEEDEREQFETYTGIDEPTLAYIIQSIEASGDEAELAARHEAVIGPDRVFDVKLRRMHREGRVHCECVAPEDMLISPSTRGDLQESPFVAQRVRKTRSEWEALGFDIALEPTGRESSFDTQSVARSSTTDELGSDSNGPDRSMQEIEGLECYLRVDFDGTGQAELRKVVRAGHQILSNEGVAEIPFAYANPIRMPHRHIGISIFDVAKDIQDIKTTLIRQSLDNTYLVNNGRVVVNDNVNVEDLLVSRPGGIVRTKGTPGADVVPLATQPIGQMIMPMVDYMDSVVGRRTGITPTTQGLDPDTLQGSTAKAYTDAMTAATAKIELMARLFAEMVKQMALLAHGCIVRHQDKPMTLKLRGQWVQVDPTSWRKRYHVGINVGLGTNSRAELRQNLMLLGQLQERAAPAGIVQPANAYATAIESAKALNFKSPERFFTDPAKIPQKPPQPNPQLQIAQIKAQTSLQTAQIKAQSDMADIAAKRQAQIQELAIKAQIAQQNAAAALAQAQVQGNVELAKAYMADADAHNKNLLSLISEANQAADRQQKALDSELSHG